jgi:hypothetical protein
MNWFAIDIVGPFPGGFSEASLRCPRAMTENIHLELGTPFVPQIASGDFMPDD